MSMIKKAAKGVLLAAACGAGLCALGKKGGIGRVVSDIAQSVEGVPFPGTAMYAFLAAKQLQPLYAAIAEQMSEDEPFRRLLHIDTGAGYLPIELARRDSSRHLIGLDESRDMIRIARANARAFGVRRSVQFRTGSPSNLPYPGRYFDRVVSVNVLRQWHNPLEVMEEVFHILEPGGHFWIYDYRKGLPEDMWSNVQCELPHLMKMALQFGPMASSRDSLDPERVMELATQSHFIHQGMDEMALPVFGCEMPAFTRTILMKPAQASAAP
jgi:ubiquinone/menaquinone biosynthesis C-methylase UbiE